MCLRTLVIITNTDCAILGHAVSPEAFNGGGAGRLSAIVVFTRKQASLPGHSIMGEEKPKSEDGLGEDIEDGVGNDLSIDVDVARPISNAPNTKQCQHAPTNLRWQNLHGVNGPENKSEPSNGTEECSGLLILVLDNATAVIGKLVDNDQVCNASHCVPSPLGTSLNSEGGEETGQDHDEVGNNSDEDVGTA